MLFNTALIAALCAAGHSAGAFHAEPNGEILVRIPNIVNMSQASDVVKVLKSAGAHVNGYGVNLPSRYDTFVGATITLDAPAMAEAA